MTIAWTTWMYDGCLIRNETRLHLEKCGLCVEDFVNSLTDKLSVIHYPGRLIVLGDRDSIIEDHEIKRGFVDRVDANMCLTRRHLDWTGPVSTEDDATFRLLIDKVNAFTEQNPSISFGGALLDSKASNGAVGLYMCHGFSDADPSPMAESLGLCRVQLNANTRCSETPYGSHPVE